MANYALADLLLFSAGAVPGHFIIYVYTKSSDCMSLDTGDSR